MTLVPGPEEEKAPETDNRNSQPVENQEDSNPEQNPVMNFFKTLVSDTIKKLRAVDISNGLSCKIRLLGENELKNCSNQK